MSSVNFFKGFSLSFQNADAQLDRFENRAYVARQLIPRDSEHYFLEEARFWAAHSSASIDGGGLGERDARRVLLQADSHYPKELETKNCLEAYSFIEHLANEPALKVDEGLIRVLNAILLRELEGEDAAHRGMYRTSGRIFQDPSTRAVLYSAPPPRQLPDLMEGFLAMLGQLLAEDHPFKAAAAAHYGLISIQPFWDGNGRTARLLADLILNMRGLAADGMLSINSKILDHRSQYYGVLREVQGESFKPELHINPFLKFSLDLMKKATIDLENRAINFSRVRDEFSSTHKLALDIRQIIGMVCMADVGPLQTAAYAQLNRCSIPTARSDLRQLCRQGLVVQQEVGRRTQYMVDKPWYDFIVGRADSDRQETDENQNGA
ncbi:MAG: Fic family protein [Chloroflexi bacterium]|nr:Fic family protein [Chloroflexota bacterium]MCY3588219.1 Fic family protein [Chloroflexota bacterium]MCY3687076.1 Fic family protein [Chloroflexota bacterium]MDE2708619.1 Fic family protein [Chloroflexota bacterium]